MRRGGHVLGFFRELPTTTPEGRLFLTGMVALGFLATSTDRNYVLLILGLFLSAVLVSVVFSTLNLRALHFERELPEAVEAGETFTVRVRVENRRRWFPAKGVLLKDALQSSLAGTESRCYAASIPAGGRVTFVYSARIRRRGAYNITNALFSTRFPFGLFEKRRMERFPCRIVVVPATRAVAADLLPGAREAALSVREPVRREPGGVEFRSLRDYRAGDNPHRIAWRVSARQGKLVLKEMERENQGPVAVLLATSLDGVPVFDRYRVMERAVSLAASLLRHFQRRRRRMLFAAPGFLRDVHHGRGAVDRCLEHLAVVRSDARGTADVLLGEVGVGRLAGLDVLLISPGPPPARSVLPRGRFRIHPLSVTEGGAGRFLRGRR